LLLLETGVPAPLESPDEPRVVVLVNRVVTSRDPDAFGELYDLFVERVYRYLYIRTGSHFEAEDLTAQVFLKAWEAIARFRWRGRPFLAWLYRLAHNAHIDHVRSQKRTTSLDSDHRLLKLASRAAGVELGRALDADMLARALRELTPDQQQVIVLKFLEDLETEQIAQFMDRREGAIRALQMRALMRLGRVLERQGEGGPAYAGQTARAAGRPRQVSAARAQRSLPHAHQHQPEGVARYLDERIEMRYPVVQGGCKADQPFAAAGAHLGGAPLAQLNSLRDDPGSSEPDVADPVGAAVQHLTVAEADPR
jgi:RNA polymerase sigma-70 factor, ECF subfamily